MNQSMPPILFEDLLYAVMPRGFLKDEIMSLLARKIKGDELDLQPRISSINDYIEAELIHLEEYIKTVKHNSPDPTERLDELFRKLLREVWAM